MFFMCIFSKIQQITCYTENKFTKPVAFVNCTYYLTIFLQCLLYNMVFTHYSVGRQLPVAAGAYGI